MAAALLWAALAAAGPAGNRRLVLTQPDGKTFSAVIRGDEFMKIMTTDDGFPVMQDADGWYCYATFSPEGERICSGRRVGTDTPPQGQTTEIPFEMMARRASELRMSASPETTPPIKRLLASRAAAGAIAQKHGIIILAEFSDLRFTCTRDDFTSLIARGRDGKGGATEYFNSQFDGLCEFSFDVSGPVTLSKSFSYYGENSTRSNGSDLRVGEMVRDACVAADPSVDFSKYDDDGDGKADNVFIFYAGEDEASGAGDYHIWSHAWYLEQGAGISLTLDGVKIDRYACASELSDGRISGIGTFCHEYGHTLGLPDLYDTDYMGSGGRSEALWGSTSIMDNGNHNGDGDIPPCFNAIEREILGISSGVIIASEGEYVLEPVNAGGGFYRFESGNPEEYHLLECRAEEGWDSQIGGSGMLIYHVDKSSNDSGYSLSAFDRWDDKNNTVNCNPEHQCADLIEAGVTAPSHQNEPDASLVPMIFFPYGDRDSFTEDTEPAFRFWNGAGSTLGITDITRDGDNIRFRVKKSDSSGIPVPQVTKSDIFQDAAIISWGMDLSFEGKVLLRWGKDGEEPQETEVKPYSVTGNTQNYAITLDSLTPRTAYAVRLTCVIDGKEGNSAYADFTTKSTVAGGKPYIYLKYVGRNGDGSFPVGAKLPLRLYNATDAMEIEWTMDGKPVSPGAGGYYIPTASGVLKATARYEDGSEETVVKEIIIRSLDN